VRVRAAGGRGRLELSGPYTRGVVHLFVSPHPDDVALSCGGVVAALRDAGEDVAIVTVFSGCGDGVRLTPYQRDALGFGSPVPAPANEARLARAAMASRRQEDAAYAAFVGAGLRSLELPDAVFRDYEGDVQLFGSLRPDDPPPVEALRSEIARLRPKQVYLPLAIGNHVDHQAVRNAGLALLEPGVGGPEDLDLVGRLRWYEDFPYAWRVGFGGLADLPPGAFADLPGGLRLVADHVDISVTVERKVRGIALYASQVGRLLDGATRMEEAVRGHASWIATNAGRPGAAERYWITSRGRRATHAVSAMPPEDAE
jgi:LmbE family N-acetylglucosaminyl deacetylase